MKEVLYFIKNPGIRYYNIRNFEISLFLNDKVFPPALDPLIAQHMQIKRGETVIDIGTGSGILGIVAGKMGAQVYATDICKEAIEVTKENAIYNNLKITTDVGNLFGKFNKKFDVIIANLSQTIVHPNYKKAIGKTLTRTINSGPNGNRDVLEFLSVARKHMHKYSRIYVVVFTVSDYKTTIQEILSNFSAKLIACNSEPAKEYISQNLAWYLKLNEEGKISIFFDKLTKKWMANQFLFELTLK